MSNLKPGKYFETTSTLRFHHADPVGIMYFGNILSLAHDGFEEFIVAAGYHWDEWFKSQEYLIPIRHVEADYNSPFFPGKTYDLKVCVAKLGQTSFVMRYHFSREAKTHAVVQMVHAVLESATQKKIPLPELLRTRLTPFLIPAEVST